MRPEDIDEERFWDKVDTGGKCWTWTGYCGDGGYGRFKVNGDSKLSHRVSKVVETGEEVDGQVLHKCDNPPCVRPSHLYVGSPSDNMKDAYERGGKTRKNGEKNPSSKLSMKEVEQIRQRLDDGENQEPIAQDMEITQSMVSKIKRGVYWNEA